MEPRDVDNYEAFDLEPIRARLDWAARHTQRLRKLVDAYVGARPFKVYLYLSDDAETVTETVTLTSDPPLPISLVLGDIAHHLRAALDNLVGVLRLGGPTRSTAFPIAEAPADFDRLAKQYMAEVPEWARRTVRELQPFDPERGSIGQTLRVVDLVAQRDRHRALLLHAPILETDTVDRAVGIAYSDAIDKQIVGHREIAFTYPAAAVVRFDYTVRIVVGETIPGAQGEDVIHLAEHWLWALRAAIDHVDAAADAAWARIHRDD